ncbi:MAG: MBL fold metallo-hydrolase [Desulfomonilia bacterium]|nr:MBL fold metallo-hydrolase [Desulfomonilia bacterium]
MSVRITWLGHASVLISSQEKSIYIDPWKVEPTSPKADIILVTHDHFDHYSEEDIRLLSTDATRVVCPVEVPLATDRIAPGMTRSITGVSIHAIPAYNLDKEFHPRENNWVGYVVEISGKTIYHTGDTDRIPEMKAMEVDVLLLPVGGTYTMDARQASEVLQDLKASHVIPIHFGDIVGSIEDAQAFSAQCPVAVHILNEGESFSLD